MLDLGGINGEFSFWALFFFYDVFAVDSALNDSFMQLQLVF